MNKPVLVVAGVVLIGCGVAGGALFAGAQVRRQLDAQTARVVEQFPFIQVVEQHDHPGVFSSSRSVTYRLGCDGVAAGTGRRRPLLITQTDMISHGPLPHFNSIGAAVIDSEISFSDELASELGPVFDGKPPLTMQTRVGFDGRYSSRIESPQGTLNGPQGQQLNWRGLTGTLESDAAMSFAHYEVTMPGMDVTDSAQGTQVSISGIHFRGDGKGTGQSMWLMAGTSEGQVRSVVMRIRAPAGTGARARETEMLRVQLDDLEIKSMATLENELLSASSSVTGHGSINATRLDKLDMRASMRRIHIPSYEKLAAAAMRDSFSCDGAHPAVTPQQSMQHMEHDMLALLPYNPEYSLDKLVIVLDGKQGEFSYSLGINGVTPADLKLPPAQLFITKAALRASARVPRTWVERLLTEARSAAAGGAAVPAAFGPVYEQARAMGYVSEDADHISTSLQFGNGAMLINGKPLGARPPQVD